MVSLFYITAFVLIIAFIDYEHLSVNHYIKNHTSRVVLRILFCWCASNSLIDFTAMLIFIGATFDNTLNLMRGLPLFKLGKTAYWDKFWRRVPGLYKAFIGTALIVSVYMMIEV